MLASSWVPKVTCGDDDPPLVGGHVGRRGAILLVHVAVVVHGVGLAPTDQLAAFANTAVHWRLPRWRGDKGRKPSLPLHPHRTRVHPSPSLNQQEPSPSSAWSQGEQADAAEAALFLFSMLRPEVPSNPSLILSSRNLKVPGSSCCPLTGVWTSQDGTTAPTHLQRTLSPGCQAVYMLGAFAPVPHPQCFCAVSRTVMLWDS